MFDRGPWGNFLGRAGVWLVWWWFYSLKTGPWHSHPTLNTSGSTWPHACRTRHSPTELLLRVYRCHENSASNTMLFPRVVEFSYPLFRTGQFNPGVASFLASSERWTGGAGSIRQSGESSSKSTSSYMRNIRRAHIYIYMYIYICICIRYTMVYQFQAKANPQRSQGEMEKQKPRSSVTRFHNEQKRSRHRDYMGSVHTVFTSVICRN